uniref:Transposase n=1 Tax=Globodera rostochiensis TaxID=31243 RepID=A0A914HBD5_GLORO
MEEFWILIFVSLFATNSLDKSESVQLEELPLQTFDELFVDEWWDKDEAEDLKTPPPTNFGQNVHHQIGRQNTQSGQIEPNSTDQNPLLTESDHSRQIEPNSTDQNPLLTESDHSRQIEPNSTDQNPLLTESDHSRQIEHNSTDHNPLLTESDHSRQIEHNSTDQNPLLTKSDRYGQIEPNSIDQNPLLTESDHSRQIEPNLTDQNPLLTESDHSRQIEPNSTDQNPLLTESDHSRQIEPNSTDQNPPLTESDHTGQIESNVEDDRKHKTVAKELGLSFRTIYVWKRELGQTAANKYDHDKQKKLLMKRYYEIKDKNPKIRNADIAKMLKIGTNTLYIWKKQFDRQHFHPNSVEENTAANIAIKLGLSFTTIYDWKRELGQTKPQLKHSHSEQKEMMKVYYEIKDQNPKIRDVDIAKKLKIGTDTLCRWKKQFKRPQFHPNSVDGHSVEENAAANV